MLKWQAYGERIRVSPLNPGECEKCSWKNTWIASKRVRDVSTGYHRLSKGVAACAIVPRTPPEGRYEEDEEAVVRGVMAGSPEGTMAAPHAAA